MKKILILGSIMNMTSCSASLRSWEEESVESHTLSLAHFAPPFAHLQLAVFASPLARCLL
ncbi:unnamed protein product [Periconia digitata]|uniref:Uncharacterized protein n=1 Tax=Periconia digitata TaxID=1303443 RepID=A0A9W4UDQ5_9PLEO|nr:unnamed protein product [Periconia digitata]